MVPIFGTGNTLIDLFSIYYKNRGWFGDGSWLLWSFKVSEFQSRKASESKSLWSFCLVLDCTL